MDRVLLTLGNTQLQAVLNRNRGLFVLFQAEVNLTTRAPLAARLPAAPVVTTT